MTARAELQQSVAPAAEEVEEAEVPQDLELLADFRADVSIGRMESGKAGFERVGVGKREFAFSEGEKGSKDVEGPAPEFWRDFGKRAKALVLRPDSIGRLRCAIQNDGDACVGGNAVEKDVATDPSGAACREGKGFASMNGRKWEGVARDEQQIARSPFVGIVVEGEEIGRAVSADGGKHGGVGGVHNAGGKRPRGTLQLEGRVAIRADVINCRRVGARPGEAVRGAAGAKEICFGPGFSGDTGALGGRLVAGEGVGGK